MTVFFDSFLKPLTIMMIASRILWQAAVERTNLLSNFLWKCLLFLWGEMAFDSGCVNISGQLWQVCYHEEALWSWWHRFQKKTRQANSEEAHLSKRVAMIALGARMGNHAESKIYSWTLTHWHGMTWKRKRQLYFFNVRELGIQTRSEWGFHRFRTSWFAWSVLCQVELPSTLARARRKISRRVFHNFCLKT